MVESYGYAKNILEVDLSKGTIVKVPTDFKLMKDYIGGTGFATKVLYDRLPPGVDPLGSDNVLIYSTGPLGGTLAPGSGRLDVTFKSPLTGMMGLTNAGGHWAPTLKYAGYEAIIVSGKSPKPVYIFVNNGIVELRDASRLWGLDTWETTDHIIAEHSQFPADSVRVLCIGPAGENLVKYASITVDYHHSASRSGGGAVMGSKGLKAIAVKGNGSVAIARPGKLEEIARNYVKRGDPYMFGNPGPSYLHTRALGYIANWNKAGSLPGKNLQTTQFPNWEVTRGKQQALQHVREAGESCHACHVSEGCVEVKVGKYAGVKLGDGLHATNIMDFGVVCAIDNFPAIFKCLELAERLGMDTHDLTWSISFAMELYQRGLLSKEDTGGLALDWGNEYVVQELMHKIAHRDGFGDILAEGSKLAAGRIGKGALNYSIDVKGMAPLPHEFRIHTTALDLGHLTSPRGGDNLRTTHWSRAFEAPPTITPKGLEGKGQSEIEEWCVSALDMFDDIKEKAYGKPPKMRDYSPKQRAALMTWCENITTVHNCLGTCFITRMGPTTLAQLYSAVTGHEMSPEELVKLGEKVFTLQRLWNVREGVRRADVDWPARFYDEPISDGPHKGKVLSRQEVKLALDAYYEFRGWDKETGIPPKEKLEELGLAEFADDLGCEARME